MRKMLDNQKEIPESLVQFCYKLNNALTPEDGFRRQAKPVLLYKYLSNMDKMFKIVHSMLTVNGYYALIIGYNSTTLGGENFEIKTPDLLIELAKSNHWKVAENMPLQTYQRYGIHHKNAISKENLIILQK